MAQSFHVGKVAHSNFQREMHRVGSSPQCLEIMTKCLYRNHDSLKGDFYDPKGAIIFTHHFKADFQEILPGEKIKYRTEIKNPPSDSVRIEITFTKN